MVKVGMPDAMFLCLNRKPSRNSFRKTTPKRKIAPKNKTVLGGFSEANTE